jgi:hypothetical protein
VNSSGGGKDDVVLRDDVLFLLLADEDFDRPFSDEKGGIAVGMVMALIPPSRGDDGSSHGDRLCSGGEFIDSPCNHQGRLIFCVLVHLIGVNDSRFKLCHCIFLLFNLFIIQE